MNSHFRVSIFPDLVDDRRSSCADFTVRNEPDNGVEYNACGFSVPDLGHYHVVKKEYTPMPGRLKGQMYDVTFQDKQGDNVTKLYYKTHLMAYTVQEVKEEPYTIVDTTCKGVYDTKYFGKPEVPQCVLELYSEAKPGGYLPGQFEEQEGFIKLRGPEPDDFNPYEDAPLSAGKQWRKNCEWWDEDSLRN